jgi:hypothetical protein
MIRRHYPDAALELWAQDEARLGLVPIVRRVWAEKGNRSSPNQRRELPQTPLVDRCPGARGRCQQPGHHLDRTVALAARSQSQPCGRAGLAALSCRVVRNPVD